MKTAAQLEQQLKQHKITLKITKRGALMTQNGKKISETGLKDLKRLFKKFGFDLTDEL
jgi:CTP-dependent riboflavin kinase